MTNIANEVGVPIICLYASSDDEFKKPNKGKESFNLRFIVPKKIVFTKFLFKKMIKACGIST